MTRIISEQSYERVVELAAQAGLKVVPRKIDNQIVEITIMKDDRALWTTQYGKEAGVFIEAYLRGKQASRSHFVIYKQDSGHLFFAYTLEGDRYEIVKVAANPAANNPGNLVNAICEKYKTSDVTITFTNINPNLSR
jgi:hypothetical protein